MGLSFARRISSQDFKEIWVQDVFLCFTKSAESGEVQEDKTSEYSFFTFLSMDRGKRGLVGEEASHKA